MSLALSKKKSQKVSCVAAGGDERAVVRRSYCEALPGIPGMYYCSAAFPGAALAGKSWGGSIML